MADLLPLLDNGSCSIRDACAADILSVTGRCPQLHKCGSCVMWSVRGASRTGRNEGQCLLDRNSRTYLDCNAPACPYYRPRRDSAAWADFQKPVARRSPTPRTRELGRDVPDPTPAALALAALGQDAGAGPLTELALELAAGTHKLPGLLERFRGGTAALKHADGSTATVPLERWFLWICSLKRALDTLESRVGQSHLGAEEKDKIIKDIKMMRGSLTTFNVLFRDKEDHFVGQKGS